MDRLKGISRYVLCALMLFAVFCIYGLRLIDWQIVNGEEILEESTKTSTSVVKMEAARGEILDANGLPLVVNKTGYDVVFDKLYLTAETQNETILRLTDLLDRRNEKWNDELPIQVDSSGKYAFISGMEDEAEKLRKNDRIRLNPYSTAEECMKTMVKLFDCAGYTPAQTRTIAAVRYSMMKAGFSLSTPYTFAENVSSDTVGIIKENSQKMPGVSVQVTTMREYPNGLIAPHIVGTTGLISAEEYQELKSKNETYSLSNISGYGYTDKIGKSGIESALENELRGKNGKKVIETTQSGALASESVTEAPSSGHTVYLTIDGDLQKAVQESLAKNVQATQANGKKLAAEGKPQKGDDCIAGGAVVLSVKDFSVLAAATYPSYDLNLYMNDKDYYSSLVTDQTKPLFNRAFNGAFMPGSCFKPMVACAALEEGVIDANSTVTCNHKYTFWDDYQPTCLGWHGSVAVRTALQKSCNIFFFDVGRRLTIQTMDLYAQRFGFGQKTGIEVSESAGTLASPERREAMGQRWEGGDVVQAAIGQSDNAFTPLQLATYAATIANNGNRMKTHLVQKVTDYSRKQVIWENDPDKPELVTNIGVSQANIDIVKQGMRMVCQPGGTAGNTFGSYGIAVAGKTGTAQNPPHSDNVVFVGFAPYENPQIAVAVVLEYGATSVYSNAVAKDIFDAYFFKNAQTGSETSSAAGT